MGGRDCVDGNCYASCPNAATALLQIIHRNYLTICWRRLSLFGLFLEAILVIAILPCSFLIVSSVFGNLIFGLAGLPLEYFTPHGHFFIIITTLLRFLLRRFGFLDVWLIRWIFNFDYFPFCLLPAYHFGNIEYLIVLMGFINDLHFAILKEHASDLVFQIL